MLEKNKQERKLFEPTPNNKDFWSNKEDICQEG